MLYFCFLFYVRWYCNAYSGDDLFIHFVMEAIKLILSLVMFLNNKRFTNFMSGGVRVVDCRLVKVNEKLKILLRYNYFKIFLLACINGLYCLTMFHLVWHNLAVNLIAFLIGALDTPLKLIFTNIKITIKNKDKFY